MIKNLVTVNTVLEICIDQCHHSLSFVALALISEKLTGSLIQIASPKYHFGYSLI